MPFKRLRAVAGAGARIKAKINRLWVNQCTSMKNRALFVLSDSFEMYPKPYVRHLDENQTDYSGKFTGNKKKTIVFQYNIMLCSTSCNNILIK